MLFLSLLSENTSSVFVDVLRDSCVLQSFVCQFLPPVCLHVVGYVQVHLQMCSTDDFSEDSPFNLGFSFGLVGFGSFL